MTRDRLVSNRSYSCLRDAVRWSLDYYATRQRLKEERRNDITRPSESSDKRLGKVRSLLLEARQNHPEDETILALGGRKSSVFRRTMDRERETDDVARTLLGPLASAGMAALALEHESRKEMRRARQLLRTLSRIGTDLKEPRIREIVERVGAWLDRLDNTRRLFAPLLDQDDREGESKRCLRRPCLSKS